MNKQYKERLNDIQIDRKDTFKAKYLQEYIRDDKFDSSIDAREGSSHVLTSSQEVKMYQQLNDPEWQEYISSQYSADFFLRKSKEIKNDIKILSQRRHEVDVRYCKPNVFEKERNWFQRKFPILRFSENRFYSRLNKETRELSEQIKNAQRVNARLQAEISRIDVRAREFEDKHIDEINRLYPKGEGKHIVVRENSRGIVHPKYQKTEDGRTTWKNQQGGYQWEREQAEKAGLSKESVQPKIKKIIPENQPRTLVREMITLPIGHPQAPKSPSAFVPPPPVISKSVHHAPAPQIIPQILSIPVVIGGK